MELALCERSVAEAFRGLSALACSKCGICWDRKSWTLESAGKLLVGQWTANLGDVYKDVKLIPLIVLFWVDERVVPPVRSCGVLRKVFGRASGDL